MFVNTHLRSGKWFLVWTKQAKTRYFIILLFIKTMLSNATYERTVKLFHLSNMKTKPAMIPFRFKDSKKKTKTTFCKGEKLTLTSVLSAIHRAICSAENPRTCNSYVSALLGFPFGGKLMKVGAEFMFSWIKSSHGNISYQENNLDGK